MSTIGRYRVERVIGSGGMAEVLRAVAVGSSGFERRVAIKRILPEFSDDATLSRMFFDEARIASRLHHANIVAVLDYGIVDGRPFQVLEWIDGLDMAAVVRRTRELGEKVPPEVALHVCAEVAHALAHAHAARGGEGAPMNVVHRDVSPSNILVSWEGDVKLTDFGIALAADRTAERTRAGVAKGKFSYMAPEQFLQGAVDGRTDVFALGCVLHSILAGRSPLGDEGALADFLVSGALAVSPDLDPHARAIVVRATSLRKEDRHESAAALASDLGATLATVLGPRDARTMFREWLTRLAPAREAPSGPLDKLLGLDIVVADGEGEIRRFSTLPPPTREPATATVPAIAKGARRERVGWRGRAIASAALAAVGAVGLVLLSRGSTVPPASSHRPVAAAPVVTAAVPTAALRPAAAAAPGSRGGPGEDPESAGGARATADSPRKRPAAIARTLPASRPEPAAHPPPVAPEPPAPEPPPEVPGGRAWLVVGGEGATGAEIRVDGRRIGFAPRLVELSQGGHAVVLVGRDGTAIADRTIQLGPRSTRSSPYRWIVPAP
ncbi:MAG: serine/threonine protein kinase [Deltaproteobacteria bacterium]|nr:serine/threonine protein kinase [Deltaproteobacteria bacterium]